MSIEVKLTLSIQSFVGNKFKTSSIVSFNSLF